MSTRFFTACESSDIRTIRRLLKKDRTLSNKTFNNKNTPLFISSMNNHSEVVELLLEKGAEVDKAANGGFTPLFIASQKGFLEVMKVIVDY